MHIDTTQMDRMTKKLLFSTFLDAIQAFYKDPENQRRFEEWQKERRLKENEKRRDTSI